MLEPLLRKFRRIWMIGIAGSGMSGIAEVLHSHGFKVSGSDMAENDATAHLRTLGIKIYKGHDPARIKDSDVVIYSSAVSAENVELKAANALKMTLIRRAEMLAELMRLKTGIAISGSHGKTTVTSLVGEIVTAGGFDPTIIVGGRLRKLGGGVVSGSGDILIAEADEYDQSFLRLSPVMVLLNNIDNDHLECYGGYQQLEDAFVQFANSVPFYGRIVVNLDDKALHPVIPKLKRPVVTYGFSPQADVRASEVSFNQNQSQFNVLINGAEAGQIKLPMPGKFNIINVLGSIAIGNELGIPFEKIKAPLEKFSGVFRRFEILGEVNNVMVVSDFGHHPTAISATLEAAKSGWKRPVIAVFQAHLYSRTAMLAEQFGQSLLGADTALILPIYPAREAPVEGVSGRMIYDAARNFGHKDVHYIENKAEVVERVCRIAEPGTMILVIGAGNVDQLGPQIVKGLEAK